MPRNGDAPPVSDWKPLATKSEPRLFFPLTFSGTFGFAAFWRYDPHRVATREIGASVVPSFEASFHGHFREFRILRSVMAHSPATSCFQLTTAGDWRPATGS